MFQGIGRTETIEIRVDNKNTRFPFAKGKVLAHKRVSFIVFIGMSAGYVDPDSGRTMADPKKGKVYLLDHNKNVVREMHMSMITSEPGFAAQNILPFKPMEIDWEKSYIEFSASVAHPENSSIFAWVGYE